MTSGRNLTIVDLGKQIAVSTIKFFREKLEHAQYHVEIDLLDANIVKL